MTWMIYKPVVTVVDVLDTGACIDGVKEFVSKVGAIVGKASDYLCEAWIQSAANSSGYGYGDGYGDGYGYGDGDGYGYGSGYGDGYGDGDGYGYGDGDGYGDGY